MAVNKIVKASDIKRFTFLYSQISKWIKQNEKETQNDEKEQISKNIIQELPTPPHLSL